MSRGNNIVLVACVAAAIAHAAWYGHVTSDDAFISLRYARNLAEGHGLVFNPDGARVEGFSNPTFTLASAFLLKMGVPPLAAVKSLGLVGWLGALLVASRLAFAIRPGWATPVAASLLLAGSTFPAIWAVAGLETMVYALLVTLGVLLAVRESEAGVVRWTPWAFLAVAASRPEGALLAAVAAAAQWLSLVGRAGWWPVIRAWSLRFALPGAALILTRYVYFGALLPNTYGAKVFLSAETTAYGVEYLAAFVRDGGAWIAVPALLGVLVSLRGVHRRAALFVTAIVLAQAAFVVLVGGDAMLGYRFVMPVYPLLCALAAVAIMATTERAGDFTNVASIALAALVALAAMTQQQESLASQSRRYWLMHERPGPYYLFDSNLEGTWLEAHAACASYVRERADPTDLIVVTEAGVLPFETGLETVDLLGLNDREIAVMWQNVADAARESEETGLPPLRQWAFDIADRALKRRPRWIVLDGHFDANSGGFVPRLDIGHWLLAHLKFLEYREVFRAPMYSGATTGLGRDRIEVVFERVGEGS